MTARGELPDEAVDAMRGGGAMEHRSLPHDTTGRILRGARIVSALRGFATIDLNSATLLDVGCSAGTIATEIARHGARVIGVDIDLGSVRRAVEARRTHATAFLVGTGLALPFRDQSFDAVVCNHVYEHVDDPFLLMREVRRVLRSGGVCYFAAGHTLQLIEPHHRLPLLSWLPRPAADAWLRALGRGARYDEKFLAPWRLTSLFEGFAAVTLISPAMLREPERFGLVRIARLPGFLQATIAASSELLARLAPTWIWLLRR